MKPQALAIAALVTIVLCSTSEARAQIPSRFPGGRYQSPSGTTITPYLNYFRRDVGVLDPFNTFVRPRQQLANQLSNMNFQSQQQGGQLQTEINNVRQSQAAPTGTSAGFMNYSHYFGGGGGGGGTAGSTNSNARRASTMSFGGY